MSSDHRVLVTGASGGIGRPLVQALLRQGHQVVAVGRDGARLPGGATPWIADLASGEGVSPAMFAGVRAIYHCAGEIARPALMRAVHVDGTRRLIEALRACGTPPPRWVQLSSVGAYGPPPRRGVPRVVDESTPERPVGEYEITKTLGDDLVRHADQAGLLRMVIVRPTAVIGRQLPCRSLRQVVGLVARRLYVHVGPVDARANYVHADDVVAAMIMCGAATDAAGEVFNVASDCRWVDLIAEAAAGAGVPPPRVRVPAGLAYGLARAGGLFGRWITPERVDALCGHTEYTTEKIHRRLGWVAQRPLPGAVRDLLGDHAYGGE